MLYSGQGAAGGAARSLKSFLGHLAISLYHLGGVGLFVMGVLDSSFLMMPLGNDLLVIALTARNSFRLPYYVAMATAGSVLGCLIIDWVSRKGGEAGLERYMSSRRLEYIKGKVQKRAMWALAVAALMPPPFPFTPFVAATAALQYPRAKLLGTMAAARAVRFSVEGALAIFFGRQILRLANSSALEYGVIILTVVSIGGSAYSVYRWAVRSRQPKTRTAGGV